MVRIISILVLLLVSVSCASVPLEAVYTSIKITEWDVGFEKDFGAGKGYIRELVPKGESINNWSSLLSIEFLEGEERSFVQYVDDFSKMRKEQCPGTKFKIIKQQEFSLTYLVSFPDCAGHKAQSEITRIFQGNDGLHRLSFAQKGAELSKDTIAKWQQEFDASYIVKGPNKQRIR